MAITLSREKEGNKQMKNSSVERFDIHERQQQRENRCRTMMIEKKKNIERLLMIVIFLLVSKFVQDIAGANRLTKAIVL